MPSVTRQVKDAGVYWLAWRPRSRSRAHRRKLGLWAPSEAIERARAAAAETSEKRERARERGARQRAVAEDRYRAELAQAITEYLAFSRTHAKLAAEIAEGASLRAAEVGSGRIGRTRTMPLEERAALAARAWIRHRYTDYESRLDNAVGDDFLLSEVAYRSVKSTANDAVDAFIADHRREVSDHPPK